MKIGIACFPTYGGSGLVASSLVKELVRQGHEVTVFSADVPVRLSAIDGFNMRIVNDVDYDLFRKHSSYGISLASHILEFINSGKIDIIHCHYAYPHTAAAILAKSLSGKCPRIVTTIHGTDIYIVGNDDDFRLLMNRSLEKSDAVSAVSAFLIQKTRDYIGFHKKIELIYNFIDYKLFKPCSRRAVLKRKLFGSDRFTILHVSNFRPLKRITDIIYAVTMLPHPDKVQLILMGSGPEEENCRFVAEKSGLKNVTFIPFQHDPVPYFQAADLFVLASEFEAFGLVLLEAIACGTPAISSRCGGPEEVLNSNINLLFDTANTREFSQKIEFARLNYDYMLEITRELRIRAMDLFNKEKIVKQYIDLYRR